MRVQIFVLLLAAAMGLSGGACRDLSGASDDPTGGQEQSGCQDRADRAQQEVETARVAHLECRESRDCVLIDPSTECRGDCPRVVAASGQRAVEETIAGVNEKICRSFVADGCFVATPGCAAVAIACQANECVTTPVG